MSAHRQKSEDRAYSERMQAEAHRGVLWVSPDKRASSAPRDGGGHYNNNNNSRSPQSATNAAGQLIAEFARDEDGDYDYDQYAVAKTEPSSSSQQAPPPPSNNTTSTTENVPLQGKRLLGDYVGGGIEDEAKWAAAQQQSKPTNTSRRQSVPQHQHYDAKVQEDDNDNDMPSSSAQSSDVEGVRAIVDKVRSSQPTGTSRPSAEAPTPTFTHRRDIKPAHLQESLRNRPAHREKEGDMWVRDMMKADGATPPSSKHREPQHNNNNRHMMMSSSPTSAGGVTSDPPFGYDRGHDHEKQFRKRRGDLSNSPQKVASHSDEDDDVEDSDAIMRLLGVDIGGRRGRGDARGGGAVDTPISTPISSDSDAAYYNGTDIDPAMVLERRRQRRADQERMARDQKLMEKRRRQEMVTRQQSNDKVEPRYEAPMEPLRTLAGPQSPAYYDRDVNALNMDYVDERGGGGGDVEEDERGEYVPGSLRTILSDSHDYVRPRHDPRTTTNTTSPPRRERSLAEKEELLEQLLDEEYEADNSPDSRMLGTVSARRQRLEREGAEAKVRREAEEEMLLEKRRAAEEELIQRRRDADEKNARDATDALTSLMHQQRTELLVREEDGQRDRIESREADGWERLQERLEALHDKQALVEMQQTALAKLEKEWQEQRDAHARDRKKLEDAHISDETISDLIRDATREAVGDAEASDMLPSTTNEPSIDPEELRRRRQDRIRELVREEASRAISAVRDASPAHQNRHHEGDGEDNVGRTGSGVIAHTIAREVAFETAKGLLQGQEEDERADLYYEESRSWARFKSVLTPDQRGAIVREAANHAMGSGRAKTPQQMQRASRMGTPIPQDGEGGDALDRAADMDGDDAAELLAARSELTMVAKEAAQEAHRNYERDNGERKLRYNEQIREAVQQASHAAVEEILGNLPPDPAVADVDVIAYEAARSAVEESPFVRQLRTPTPSGGDASPEEVVGGRRAHIETLVRHAATEAAKNVVRQQTADQSRNFPHTSTSHNDSVVIRRNPVMSSSSSTRPDAMEDSSDALESVFLRPDAPNPIARGLVLPQAPTPQTATPNNHHHSIARGALPEGLVEDDCFDSPLSKFLGPRHRQMAGIDGGNSPKRGGGGGYTELPTSAHSQYLLRNPDIMEGADSRSRAVTRYLRETQNTRASPRRHNQDPVPRGPSLTAQLKSEHALEQKKRQQAAVDASLRLPHNASGMTSDIVTSRGGGGRFVPNVDRSISGLSPVPVDSRRPSTVFQPTAAATSRSSVAGSQVGGGEPRTVWGSPRRPLVEDAEPTRDSMVEIATRDLSPPRPITHEMGVDPIVELQEEERQRSEEVQRRALEEAAELEARQREVREARERQMAEEENRWLEGLRERQHRREAIEQAERDEEAREQQRREESRRLDAERQVMRDEAKLHQAKLDAQFHTDPHHSQMTSASKTAMAPLGDRNSIGRLTELRAQFNALKSKTDRPFAK